MVNWAALFCALRKGASGAFNERGLLAMEHRSKLQPA